MLQMKSLLPKKKGELAEWLTEEPVNESQVSLFTGDGLNPRFAKADKRERFNEFIRVKFNVYAVTVLIVINVFILAPIGFSTWLANTFAFFDYAPLNYLPWSLTLLLWILPYLTWQYSTITIPVMKGFDVKIDWSKKAKGRKLSALLNLGAFHLMCWGIAAKYITEEFVPYLNSVQVQDFYRGILLTDNLDSLILLIFISPIAISLVSILVQARDYMINKDLLEEHFMTWEAPYIQRFAHEYKLDTCDVIVGYEIDTKKPIVIKENQRFLHEGIIGATGSGKTSTTLLLRAAQDLKNIATNRRKMGLVFLEPKGDAIDDILDLAKELGIPDEKIIVIDPTKQDRTTKYNPFAGHREVAAMSFQGTLNALTGDQDEFFKGQQNEAAQIYTLLAKIRFGPATNVTHIQTMFMDARFLADVVEAVRSGLEIRKMGIRGNNGSNENLSELQEAHEISSIDMILSYFENQVLDYKETRKGEQFEKVLYPPDHPRHANKQIVMNKKEQFITGAKKYLNEIALNSMLKSLFISEDGEKEFDADEFLLEGGILLVNTALPDLEELSLMFGQFFIRQFQSAIFRRPKDNRIPIYFYIDEFPLYVNEAFERILTLGRSYRVGALIAMQSIAQLEAAGKHLRDSILGNASHKTVFGRGPVNDNEYFSKEFGDILSVEESLNESASPMTSEKQTWGYRFNTQKKLVPRFTPDDIRLLKFKEMIVQVVDEENSIARAVKARGQFVNEAKFITSFLNAKHIELKSTKEEDFYAEMYIPKEKLSTFVSDAASEQRMVGDQSVSYNHEHVENLEKESISFETSHPPEQVDTLSEELIQTLENEKNHWNSALNEGNNPLNENEYVPEPSVQVEEQPTTISNEEVSVPEPPTQDIEEQQEEPALNEVEGESSLSNFTSPPIEEHDIARSDSAGDESISSEPNNQDEQATPNQEENIYNVWDDAFDPPVVEEKGGNPNPVDIKPSVTIEEVSNDEANSELGESEIKVEPSNPKTNDAVEKAETEMPLVNKHPESQTIDDNFEEGESNLTNQNESKVTETKKVPEKVRAYASHNYQRLNEFIEDDC